MATPQFHELVVSAVRRLTDDSVAVRFAVPSSLAADYQYIPGQYLTLRAEVQGEDIRRSYSICSSVDDALEVGIKRVDGGVFSEFAQFLVAGDTLQVMTPRGNFLAPIGGRHRYLLVAAGSGITPCLSIAKSVLHAESESEIVLLYGNRNASTIMFRDDINALKDTYTERLMVTHLLSGERQDAKVLNGRIDGGKLREFSELQLIEFNSFDGIYLCGPFEMIEDTRAVFKDFGIPESKIHFELFNTGTARPAVRAVPSVGESAANQTTVKIIIDGAERDIAVNSNTETVLGAAQKAGMDLPFSCAGGMCATCRCKVIDGSTAMDMNFSLADWEVEAGFTLACQTRPLDADVVLDFDAT